VLGARGGASLSAHTGFRVVPDPLEPGILPEKQTARLTPTMRSSAAAKLCQMNSAQHPAPLETIGRITRLVSPLEHAEPSTAELLHFRHERQTFQLPALVQGLQDFFLTAHLNPFICAQF
jgi:hypothetical protein